MKWLKHILVMVALLVAAMPCCHAHAAEMHDHGEETAAVLCLSHVCGCQPCDSATCADEMKMPQQAANGSTPAPAVPRTAVLVVFPTSRLVVRQAAPPRVSGTLDRLQTIQLLI